MIGDDEPPYFRWWFGESWGAPICRELHHGPTPVGALCSHCRKPIEWGDQGIMMPLIDSGGVWPIPYHIGCLMQSIGTGPRGSE